MKTILTLTLLVLTLLFTAEISAHAGKTNAKGCHAGADGKVHCHKGKSGQGKLSLKVKKGRDGRCYPSNHPKYASIKAVKTYDSLQACVKDG